MKLARRLREALDRAYAPRMTAGDVVTAIVVFVGLVIALYIGMCASSPWPGGTPP